MRHQVMSARGITLDGKMIQGTAIPDRATIRTLLGQG